MVGSVIALVRAVIGAPLDTGMDIDMDIDMDIIAGTIMVTRQAEGQVIQLDTGKDSNRPVPVMLTETGTMV